MAINETSILVLEGQNPSTNNFSTNTFIFNSVYGSWVRGPSLQQPRRSAGCGLIRESESSDRKLFIVAGGEDVGGPVLTVELLHDVQGSWFFGNSISKYWLEESFLTILSMTL